MSQDPFSQVYNAIWDMLEAHQGFADLVKVANRIKFADNNPDPWKREIQDGDLPEVAIYPSDGVPQLDADSSETFITLRFNLLISTGDRRVDALIFPVLWETLRAMAGWRLHLETLAWNGQPFVRDAYPTTFSENLTDAENNRKKEGWTGLCGYEVQLNFTTAHFRPAA